MIIPRRPNIPRNRATSTKEFTALANHMLLKDEKVLEKYFESVYDNIFMALEDDNNVEFEPKTIMNMTCSKHQDQNKE